MQLHDHVSITVADLARARPFYEAIMAALGAPMVYERDDAVGFGQRNRANDDAHTYFSLYRSPATSADPRRHWCFRARSAAEVRAFFAAGMRAGGTADGEPGLRPDYHTGYFAAFLRDPEGNRVEAVFHQRIGISPTFFRCATVSPSREAINHAVSVSGEDSPLSMTIRPLNRPELPDFDTR